MAAGGAALADGFQFTSNLSSPSSTMRSSAASSIGSIAIAGSVHGQCAQHTHVFILRITSLPAQTGYSALAPVSDPLWTANVRIRLPTSLCCADEDRLA